MKPVWLSLLLVLFAGAAQAVDLDNIGPRPEDKTAFHVNARTGTPDGREGGETIETAFVIPGLPFSDTGNTCDYSHDYDADCPWGSNAPDAVFAYTAPTSMVIFIDLCASLYDTKVYVYEDVWTLNPFACNDDAGCGYSGWQSRLDFLELTGGSTYYIVVDGYWGDCGEYVLDVFEVGEECYPDCPPGGLPEGEPVLHDNYVDHYNGGCNTYPPVFQVPEATDSPDCITVCGRSGWYIFQGQNYRDTDWFEVRAAGSMLECQVEADFPVNLFNLGPLDCGSVGILDRAEALPCRPAHLSIATTPGQVHWLWVGPQAFLGPVTEFDYVFTVCGIYGPVPTEKTSWGQVKELYR